MISVNLITFNSNNYSTYELINLFKLTNEEVLLFDKYQNENVKKEKIVSYFLKRKYIGDFHIDDNGKPLSNNVFFNISHSHGFVVLVKNDSCQVGVDVELINDVEESLMKYVCSEEEYQYISSKEDFIKIWTNKESLAKCNGEGIKVKPNVIPALPISGIRNYKNKEYNTKNFEIDNAIISVTIESKEDFEVVIEK